MAVWPKRLNSLVNPIMASAYFIITSALECTSEAILVSTIFFKLPLGKKKFQMYDTQIPTLQYVPNLPVSRINNNNKQM